MKASGKKFVCIFHEDRLRRDAWVGFLTWRLGFRGQYIVRGRTESELREKLARLDPITRFHSRCETEKREERPPHPTAPRLSAATIGDLVEMHLGGREDENVTPH
jgi:hypothetical protein